MNWKLVLLVTFSVTLGSAVAVYCLGSFSVLGFVACLGASLLAAILVSFYKPLVKKAQSGELFAALVGRF